MLHGGQPPNEGKMDLVLRRIEYRDEGVFGELTATKFKDFHCIILEYAHLEKGAYISKLPSGIYTCSRTKHKLKGADESFATFEILGLETPTFFQTGNYASDIQGNNLIIAGGYGFTLHMRRMVVSSPQALKKLMDLQEKCDKFQLSVDI